MPPPVNLDSKRNADWLAGAEHGRAAAEVDLCARIKLIVSAMPDAQLNSWDYSLRILLIAELATRGWSPP